MTGPRAPSVKRGSATIKRFSAGPASVHTRMTIWAIAKFSVRWDGYSVRSGCVRRVPNARGA